MWSGGLGSAVCSLFAECTRVEPSFEVAEIPRCIASEGGSNSFRPLSLAHARGSSTLLLWPHLRQDYPLNLSILISGGKENNCDFLSNGEWNGNSPALNCLSLIARNVVFGVNSSEGKDAFKSPWQGPQSIEGDRPVVTVSLLGCSTLRVELLGSAAQSAR